VQDRVKRDFWSELPAFQRAWADHVRRWPKDEIAAAVDRSRDPAGSWRGDGGQYLDPEQHTQAKDEISRVQRAEKAVTRDMREAGSQNECGGWLEGLDYRLKSEDRLKEKLAEKIEHEPGKTVATALGQVSDAIRYTFCFEPMSYVDGCSGVTHHLEEHGYRMIYGKNHWLDNPEYKGINTRWVTAEGQRFEVQFHTPESFHAKQHVTHWSYERLRNPLTEDDERTELRSYQREVCTWIGVPRGIQVIGDFPQKGHV
jgi:hypothetical protein